MVLVLFIMFIVVPVATHAYRHGVSKAHIFDRVKAHNDEKR